MRVLVILFYAVSAITAITISPNGNSPKIKMIRGMMVDVQQGFTPSPPDATTKTNHEKSRKVNNATKLSINERYRRLIPYMTFYYANDLPSTTEAYHNKDVEVERAQIVEQQTIEQQTQRPQKKYVLFSSQRNIPRFEGNRLTQFNIASSNPTKVYYNKDGDQVHYQNTPKVTQNYNPIVQDHVGFNDDIEHVRFVQKQVVKAPSAPFSTRKPFLNIHHSNDAGNIQYYLANKDQIPKYKLVPYEQTPPIKVNPQAEGIYEYTTKKPVPIQVVFPKEPVYIKQRPARPQYIYENVNVKQLIPRKPAVVSENYYEKRRPLLVNFAKPGKPVVEGGFKPIINPLTTEAPVYTTILPSPVPQLETEKPVIVETAPPVIPEIDYRPNYYQYVVEEPTYKPEPYTPEKTVSLADLLNSLQLNKSIPKPITRENVGSSIRTLLQVLNALKAMQQDNELEVPVLSTPKPFISAHPVEVTANPELEVTAAPAIDDTDLHEEPYLAHVNTPSQHLDDFAKPGTTSQRFPQPVHSAEEGGTPGQPGVDYPVLTSIPPTSFDCKTQRYKGFFADPETRCQVWHYCDLNGGQASFLCPNGTIFSQAGLTCDWWFNVRCASTTQLYVLNESLYKYILPHSPKFPEDYSGPLVDKYLTLKFKEMEEQFKKNKNKQSAKDKIDSDETEDSSEDSTEETEASDKTEAEGDSEVNTVSEASVVVVTPGVSGNVERLHD